MDPIYIQKVNTRNIHISDNTIPKIFIPNWMNRQPNVDNLVPPVVIDIGNPIVEIPGCVKMHKMISNIRMEFQLIKIWLKMILIRQ